MTYEEIGDTLGLPSGTVKTRMRLALDGFVRLGDSRSAAKDGAAGRKGR